MAWTYSSTTLNTTTSPGRLNVVRLLIGDVDTTDQQLQDEEINFGLTEAPNVYYAAAYCCRLLAAKYSRMVDTQLDGALQAMYSDRIKNYNLLYVQMNEFAKKASGKNLGVFAGGISVIAVDLVNANSDRVKPVFNSGQFDNPGTDYGI